MYAKKDTKGLSCQDMLQLVLGKLCRIWPDHHIFPWEIMLNTTLQMHKNSMDSFRGYYQSENFASHLEAIVCPNNSGTQNLELTRISGRKLFARLQSGH